MLLLNITNIIEEKVADSHLEWLQQTYIPLIRSTFNFQELKLFKIVDSPNDGISISLQLITENPNEIERFKQKLYPALQQKMHGELKGSLFIFDSLLDQLI